MAGVPGRFPFCAPSGGLGVVGVSTVPVTSSMISMTSQSLWALGDAVTGAPGVATHDSQPPTIDTQRGRGFRRSVR